MIKLIFDLRTISEEDVEDDLCVLMDSGYTPEMERALANFVGKKVKVIFKEIK